MAHANTQVHPLVYDTVQGDPEGLTVVMLHGYGANRADLAPLAHELGRGLSPRATWVFPDAPLEIDIGYGMMGRAWFSLRLSEFERAMAEGRTLNVEKMTSTTELDAAAESVLSMLKNLGVPLDRLVLGGFSQGAMLATEVVLRLPQAPRGLLILSGVVGNGADWGTRARRHEGMPFFQSHGRQDPVLSYAEAVKLEAVLKGAGWKGSMLSFSGGHEIPMEVVRAARGFLSELQN